MMRINICFSANSKYIRYLYIALISIFENNRDNKLTVYILQRDFTDNDKEVIWKLTDMYSQKTVFIETDEARYSRFPTRDRYTLETYFRFEIPTALPETIEKVIYFDVDMIITGDLAELYDIDLSGYYFAACQDMMARQLLPAQQMLFKRTDDLRYFNAGMMVWNLKEMRGKVSFDDFVNAAEELDFNLPLVDQDVLNYKYYKKTLFIDPKKYNFMVSTYCRDGWTGEYNNALVLHYTGVNPWNVGPKAPLYETWWDYARKSPFYVELLEEQLRRTEEYLFEREKNNYVVSKEMDYPTQLQIMLEIKGMGVVKKILSESEEKYCIWGGGALGKAFCELVHFENVGELIAGIIDGKDIKTMYNIPIYHDMGWFEDNINYHIIITPYKKVEEIRQRIISEGKSNVEVSSLSELLVKLKLMSEK